MPSINIDLYFDESSNPMLICRANTLQIIEANKAALSLFGYSNDEIGALSLPELCPPEMAPELRNMQEAEPGSFEELGEWKWGTESGDVIYLDAKVCPVLVDENPCRLIVIDDVTQHKELESELQESGQILNIIKEKLPGTFFVFDMEGRMNRWNNYLEEITDYSSEEIGNMNALDFFEDDEKEKISNAIQKVVDEGAAEVRGSSIGKHGKAIPLLFKASRAQIDGKDRIIGIGVDISNVIEAQKEAERHQKLLQALIDQSQSVIYIKDEENDLKFANKKYYDLFGIADKEKLATPNDLSLNEEQAKNIQKNDDYIRETGKTLRFEEELNINGEKKTFLSTKMLLEGVDQYENCIFGISTDITDRKRTEEQLAQSLKEKEILLSEIHHRVKNNLAIISGLLDLEIMESTDEELKGKLQDSQTRINSIATTHEMLYQEKNFSDLDFEKTIKRLVERIIDTFDSDVSMQYDIESIDLNINQALPCSLIVNELITNALKHAFETDADNIIRVEAKQADGKVQLEISDNGKGFSPETNLGTSMTLGMQLINTLVSQLNGEGGFSNDNGTTFELNFEKQNTKGVGSSLF